MKIMYFYIDYVLYQLKLDFILNNNLKSLSVANYSSKSRFGIKVYELPRFEKPRSGSLMKSFINAQNHHL